MKKANANSRVIVVDASVARAAGLEGATHPTSFHCAQFLQVMMAICHQAAFTEELSREWDKHQSSVARRWRSSMIAKKKLIYLESDGLDHLYGSFREQILRDYAQRKQAYPNDEFLDAAENNMLNTVLKDVHLIDAAIKTDSRVASLEKEIRGHFRDLAPAVPDLKQIVWVNPAIPEEEAVAWLEQSAPPDAHRKLGFREPQQ